MACSPGLLALVIIITPITMPIVHALNSSEYNRSVTCNMPQCSCFEVPAGDDTSLMVNCSFTYNEKFDVMAGDLPWDVTELDIWRADAVFFGPHSLTKLQSLRQIRMFGPKLVVMKKNAGTLMEAASMFLKIVDVEELRFEENVFYKIKGPLYVDIKNSDYVRIEREAFSWLVSFRISDVRRMELAEEALMLDSSAANVGTHGPGLKIEIDNVKTPDLPSCTFGSSAASIILKRLSVNTVHANAFSANTYNTVIAINCTFEKIAAEAFAEKSLFYDLKFERCVIKSLDSGAFKSAVSKLNITNTTFNSIQTGAFNATVAKAEISYCQFFKLNERSLELSSYNRLHILRNKFNEIPPNAIIVSGSYRHELYFEENELETPEPYSLSFINDAHNSGTLIYGDNYYGESCYCDVDIWLASVLNIEGSLDYILSKSHCVTEALVGVCYNVPDLNMLMNNYMENVCGDEGQIQCEPFKKKPEGILTEIRNNRFPHVTIYEQPESSFGFKTFFLILGIIAALLVFFGGLGLYRWRNTECCYSLENFFYNLCTCNYFTRRICTSRRDYDDAEDNRGSRLSTIELTERQHLNDTTQIQETNFKSPVTKGTVRFRTEENKEPEQIEVVDVKDNVSLENKSTQTLPEELTKELIDILYEQLNNSSIDGDAHEIIEHLYEMVKAEKNYNTNDCKRNVKENIYDLPILNTGPRVGKNKKIVISVGTRVPSLERLTVPSPYDRLTALSHEYFEPKDFAAHLYSEIAIYDQEKRARMNAVPDLVAEQVSPRGPYLRSKMANSTTSPTKSHGSTDSNCSRKMMNRPLPEKPLDIGAGEGTSTQNK